MNRIYKCPHCGNYSESEIQHDEDGTPYCECEWCGAETVLDAELIADG